MNDSLWTTQDGRKIKVCNMGDGHLINTMNMLEKVAKYDYKRIVFMDNPFHGEIASDDFDRAQSNLLEHGWEGCLPEIYTEMMDEALERSLHVIDEENG